MPLLGFDVPAKEIDILFDQFDPDGSGEMGFRELQKMLRSNAAAKPAEKTPAPKVSGRGLGFH